MTNYRKVPTIKSQARFYHLKLLKSSNQSTVSPIPPRNKQRIAVILIAIATSLLMIGLLFSCSPSQRLNRLLANNPNLAHKATLIHYDTTTIMYPGVSKDTLIERTITNRYDTLIIREKNLTIKSYITDSTQYLFGSCDTIRDTIYKTIEIPYDQFNYTKKTDWPFLIFMLILGIIVFIIFKI